MNINLRLPDDVHMALKASAEKNHRSLNSEILHAVEDYASRKNERALLEKIFRKYAALVAEDPLTSVRAESVYQDIRRLLTEKELNK